MPVSERGASDPRDHSAVARHANVLLHSAPVTPLRDPLGRLFPEGSTDPIDGIFVSYTATPESVASTLSAFDREPIGQLCLITVDNQRTSPTGAPTADGWSSADDPQFLGVESTSADPTSLGMVVTKALEHLEGADRPTAFYFDSLTALCQYVDTDTAFEFLDVLTDTVAAADATGYYEIDPLAHDDAELATIRRLFDDVLDG
jgi:hypothetical protein